MLVGKAIVEAVVGQVFEFAADQTVAPQGIPVGAIGHVAPGSAVELAHQRVVAAGPLPLFVLVGQAEFETLVEIGQAIGDRHRTALVLSGLQVARGLRDMLDPLGDFLGRQGGEGGVAVRLLGPPVIVIVV